MAGVIYYIRSAATGRTYVGSTTRGIKQRWSESAKRVIARECRESQA